MDQVELHLENAACFDEVCRDLPNKADNGFKSVLLLCLIGLKAF